MRYAASMGWHDRDYSKSRRREPDDDDFTPPADSDASWDEDEASSDDEDMTDVDPEAPDASDQDDDDAPPHIRCPNCNKMIVEDAEWCPHCGEFVEEVKLSGRPMWVWVGLLLAIGVAVMWAVFH